MHAHKTDFNAMILEAHLIPVIEKIKISKTVSPEALRKMIKDLHPAVSNDARSKK